MPLPKSSGGMLTVELRLVQSFAVAPQLLRDADATAHCALVQAWRQVRERIFDETLNPIAWLDDALFELSEANIWVPAIFLKRLRQLQRGELYFMGTNGKRIAPVVHHGLPASFVAAAECIGAKFTAVRRLSSGYEDPITSADCTGAVESLARAWDSRPSREHEARNFLIGVARESGWRL